MFDSHAFRKRLLLAGALAVLAGVLLLGLAGCGDDDKNPATPGGGGATSTTFSGAFTNGTENGKITVVINSTSLAGRMRAARAGGAMVTATGTLRFSGGSTVTVTGSYDTVTDSITMTGGGYTFVGEYDDTADPPSVGGYYTGPNGTGAFGALAPTAGAVEIYIGTFESDSTGVTGVFDMARYDTLAGVLAFVQGDTEPTFLDGTVTGAGTTKSITLSGGEPGVFEVTATGTLNTTTQEALGIWHTYDFDISKGDDGTWTGTLLP